MNLNTKFFSGFCFLDEALLFKDYLEDGVFNVAGFSYGAQKAFEYALNSNTRVDLLQLFSPAFFQEKDEKFKRLQLLHFKKNEKIYIEDFLKNANKNSNKEIKEYIKNGQYCELEELLSYVWDEEKLEELTKKGTRIEVFIGQKDEIVDTKIVNDFFKNFADVYFIKNIGHLL